MSFGMPVVVAPKFAKRLKLEAKGFFFCKCMHVPKDFAVPTYAVRLSNLAAVHEIEGV